MGLIEFVASLFFYVWIAASIFWGTAGAALAVRFDRDVRVAIPVSMFFHLLGAIGIWIAHQVRKHEAPRAAANATAGYDFQTSNWGSATTFDALSADQTFGWGQTPATPFESDFGGKPARRNSTRAWLTTGPGAVILYGSFLLVLTSVWSLFLTWFNIVTPEGDQGVIYGFSTGFDFWTFVSIGELIGAVLLNLRGPSLISAMLFSLAGTGWLLLAMASLTARDVFVLAVDKLFQIPNLVNKRGDFELTWAFDVGNAWYVVFANAVLMIAASVWLIVQASRAKSPN